MEGPADDLGKSKTTLPIILEEAAECSISVGGDQSRPNATGSDTEVKSEDADGSSAVQGGEGQPKGGVPEVKTEPSDGSILTPQGEGQPKGAGCVPQGKAEQSTRSAPLEEGHGRSVTAECTPAIQMVATPGSTKINLEPQGQSQVSTCPNDFLMTRHEIDDIKRRLTIFPGKSGGLFPLSSIESFCRKSQEALNLGLDESSIGLLGVPMGDEERRKSVGGALTSAQSPSKSFAGDWREELKALKEELALPASVSLRISGMEKTSGHSGDVTCEVNVSHDGNPSTDGTQKDPPTLNLGVTPPPPALLFNIDLDFLSRFGTGLINSDLARKSVFIQFDPVVEKALKEPGPSAIKREELTLGVSEEERVRRLSEVHQQMSNNRKRDMKELDDLIEKLLMEIEEQESKSETPDVLSTTQQTELLMRLDVEIPRLKEELNEPPREIQKLLDDIDECDRLAVQLKAELKEFEAQKAKVLEEKVQDNNSHKEHLEYMEEMFDKVYQNYQKAKESRKGLLRNKAALEKHNQQLTEMESKFKENLSKVKAEHEQLIMKAKKELASKEAEIRELEKQKEPKGVSQALH